MNPQTDTHNNSGISTEVAIALSLLPPYLQQSAIQSLRAGASFEEVTHTPSLIAPLRSRRVAAQNAIEDASALGLTVIPLGSQHYPAQLMDLHSPPCVLFIKGHLPTPSVPFISIVGSRSASVLTCQHTSQVAKILAEAGYVIVSGLALGIDGASHRGALLSGQTNATIAVLAHGLDTTYPRSHSPLAQHILERGGCLISEYPPGTQPLRHHFLARNRIIAALSQCTIVAEAGERSGSLVTAQVALDLSREVVVLNHPEAEGLLEGSQRLIEDGAISITNASELLGIFNQGSPTTTQLDSQDGSATISKPASQITIPLSELLRISNYSVSYLLQMELDGALTRLPGNSVKLSSDLFDKICSLPVRP